MITIKFHGKLEFWQLQANETVDNAFSKTLNLAQALLSFKILSNISGLHHRLLDKEEL